METGHQLLMTILVLFLIDEKLLVTNASDKQLQITDNVAYFQASNSKNQLGGRTAISVKYNIIDGANEYALFNNGTFTYNKGGIYFAFFATQIGSPNRNGKGEIHLWVRRDQDKPFSNNIQTVARGATSVLIYQTVFRAPVNRVATLVFSAISDNECSSLGLIAAAPENEPQVPSIILSTIQLSDANNTIPYAELISAETQLGDLNATVIRLGNYSGMSRIDATTSGKDGIIKYNESGLYFIIACAQVGSDISANASGEFHLWMRLNGVDMPNSNTIQSIHNGSSAVLISQTIAKLDANNTLQLMFSTTDKRLGIIASRPANEPVVPSMIFSTFRLRNEGDLIPYAQLSSSKTQWGCLGPKGVELANNDGSQRIKNSNGVMEFNESGTYFVMSAAQVGSETGEGIGDVHLWMRLNGQDMANSNAIQTVFGDTAVLICQSDIVVRTGDKLQIMFSTDVATGRLGLVASQPQNEPAVPSIIVSAFKSSYVADDQSGTSNGNRKQNGHLCLVFVVPLLTYILLL